MTPRESGHRSVRTSLAVGATRAVNGLSRRLGLGSGTVAGGRVGLWVDPDAVARLAARRASALVTGTNGKTTTTRLLALALEALGEPVVSNVTGANMPAGHLAALASGSARGPIVLEVDEGYLPAQLRALDARAVVLLNLSRDQLDRTNEVRMIANRWRDALQGASETTVVANADDPLVVWGASSAPRVRWVAAGLRWHADAVGCPACGRRLAFEGDGDWRCTCGFRRPVPDLAIERDGASTWAWRADGTSVPITLALPGAFNEANALMAAAGAEVFGVELERALAAMGAVREVAGRFTHQQIGEVRARLLLAKNPAGWDELLALVAGGHEPVVVAINARIADGRDPSWLWDVPFEMLRGRVVVAAGERCLDLSVRLHYADVAHTTVRELAPALAAAAQQGATTDVEFIGNYTAFHDLWRPR